MAEIKDHTKRFMARAETATEKAIAIAVGKGAREARRLLNLASSPPPSKPGEPPHKRIKGGELGASIKWQTFRDKGVFRGRFGTNVRYGRYLELGTRGGTVIVPKRAKMLSWIGADGKRRFAKKVTMKPLAPRPFLRPVLDRIVAKELTPALRGQFAAEIHGASLVQGIK